LSSKSGGRGRRKDPGWPRLKGGILEDSYKIDFPAAARRGYLDKPKKADNKKKGTAE